MHHIFFSFLPPHFINLSHVYQYFGLNVLKLEMDWGVQNQTIPSGTLYVTFISVFPPRALVSQPVTRKILKASIFRTAVQHENVYRIYLKIRQQKSPIANLITSPLLLINNFYSFQQNIWGWMVIECISEQMSSQQTQHTCTTTP